MPARKYRKGYIPDSVIRKCVGNTMFDVSLATDPLGGSYWGGEDEGRKLVEEIGSMLAGTGWKTYQRPSLKGRCERLYDDDNEDEQAYFDCKELLPQVADWMESCVSEKWAIQPTIDMLADALKAVDDEDD